MLLEHYDHLLLIPVLCQGIELLGKAPDLRDMILEDGKHDQKEKRNLCKTVSVTETLLIDKFSYPNEEKIPITA